MSAAEVLDHNELEREAIRAENGPTMLAELLASADRGLETNLREFLRFAGVGAGRITLELQTLGEVDRFASNRCAYPATIDDAVRLAEDAERRKPVGVYAMANEPDAIVATRGARGTWRVMGKGESTTDADMVQRWLAFFDFDFERATNTSATADEVRRVFDVADRARARFLRGLPPGSVGVGHSGNGASLMVALDGLPETPELAALVKGLLEAAHRTFSDPEHVRDRKVRGVVGVDTTVCDAKRLCPAFGTTKRKGSPDVPERPHRRTAFLAPATVQRIGVPELEALLADLVGRLDAPGQEAVAKATGRRAEPKARATPPPASHDQPRPRVPTEDDPFARAKELPIRDVLTWLGLLDGEQAICPGCGLSDQGVAVFRNGLTCRHDRCADKGIKPGWRTTVDCVVEARCLKPIEAVRALGEQFGFEVPTKKKRAAARPAPAAGDWRERLVTTQKGDPAANVANAILAVGNAWPGVFAFDDFAQKIRIAAPPPWDAADAPGPVELGAAVGDTDVTRVVAWFARHEGIDVSTDTMWKALAVVAEANRVHPVRSYLEGVAWDGTPRVDWWLVTYLGAADTPYVHRVGGIILRSAVARALRPGCKVDTMAVLEGPQGVKKSSAIRALFGRDWTSDSPLDFASKDRFVQVAGKWGVEVPELDGCDRADVSRIKSFLSSPVDDYRPPYGRASIRAPRQCVLIGTMNPGGGGYLRDLTGNRRFLPFPCGRIDLEAIERDRDQLWAEAMHQFLAGMPWWPDAREAELFTTEQDARVVVDAWEDKIARYLEKAAGNPRFPGPVPWTRETQDGRPFVTVADMLERPLALTDSKDQTPLAQNRVANALHRLGWERTRLRLRPDDGCKGDGVLTRGYVLGSPFRGVPGDLP